MLKNAENWEKNAILKSVFHVNTNHVFIFMEISKHAR